MRDRVFRARGEDRLRGPGVPARPATPVTRPGPAGRRGDALLVVAACGAGSLLRYAAVARGVRGRVVGHLERSGTGHRPRKRGLGVPGVGEGVAAPGVWPASGRVGDWRMCSPCRSRSGPEGFLVRGRRRLSVGVQVFHGRARRGRFPCAGAALTARQGMGRSGVLPRASCRRVPLPGSVPGGASGGGCGAAGRGRTGVGGAGR